MRAAGEKFYELMLKFFKLRGGGFGKKPSPPPRLSNGKKPPMRGGGSTNSIACGAETSDPMMLISGSLERGNTYLSNNKKMKTKY